MTGSRRRVSSPLYTIRAARTASVRHRPDRPGYAVESGHHEETAPARRTAIRTAQHRAAARRLPQNAPLPRPESARRWGIVGILGATDSQQHEVAAYRNNTYVLGHVHWDTGPLDSTSGATTVQWVYRSRRAATRAFQYAERLLPIPLAAGFHRTREEPRLG